jgi:hypothetical protein
MECYQIDAPKEAEGVDSFWAPASSLKLPGIENFFAKTPSSKGLPPFWGKPFLDRFLGEGA